jgi:hypothetical protein
MLKTLTAAFLFLCCFSNAQTNTLTTKMPDGRLTLSDKGVAYFTKLSLGCVKQDTPHYNPLATSEADHANYKIAKKDWPSFYGCFDWHSGVHNHWALVRLLKKYPNAKEAALIKTQLEESFKVDNILKETQYFKDHEKEFFEFPYGTTWLLKVADELITWDNADAKRWLKNLEPLVNLLVENYNLIWPKVKKPLIPGNHYSFAFGLSFAIDYSRSAKNTVLEGNLVKAAKKFYADSTNFPLLKEPFPYDFMSAGLLIADLMRKVYNQKDYEIWLKKFAPGLVASKDVAKVLYVKKLAKHDGFESHYDGFHLNRIWCLNGILQSISEKYLDATTKKQWIASQEEMWNYAQESIGKGNYDIDHWLSSFSVFALEGYK